MLDTTIKITDLQVIDAPFSNRKGQLMALFSVATAGMEIKSCALIETTAGDVVVKGPNGKNHKGNAVSVQFIDPALTAAVLKRAHDAYLACTGREVAA
ncbi:hypothetical protein [Citreimonas sp.]|uniref:hypothetical protein n=1 Tax=Citreimonas sp. TaxID=3036715 RepID=UPI004058153B